MEDKNISRMWVYPPTCRTKVGARWSPSFPRQSLARRRARNIVQVHAHALNGSWECYHVVRIGLGAIWGDHGRKRSLHFTTPHFCLKKGWVYPLCPFPFFFKHASSLYCRPLTRKKQLILVCITRDARDECVMRTNSTYDVAQLAFTIIFFRLDILITLRW